MHDLICLIKRHVLRFLRDKAAVFFSFLSIMIMLALYFLFIGEQYTSGPEMEGLDEGLKTYLTIGIVMGGILVINTVSLSLGMMGNIILDLEQHKLDGFLVTPVRRYKLILSYYIAAILVTGAFSLLMWGLTILYVGIVGGYWYSFLTILEASGYILLFTLMSSSFMIYLTTLLRSVNAFSTLSGVLGTFIGFVSGIYMPLFVLGRAMVHVASLVPFTHMTIILRNVLLEEPYRIIEAEFPPEAMEAIRLSYGTDEIGVIGFDVPLAVIIFLSGLLAVSFLVMSYRRMIKKISG
ncbi:MAG: ABC transporter permease [Acholeplasmataceae bacterium]